MYKQLLCLPPRFLILSKIYGLLFFESVGYPIMKESTKSIHLKLLITSTDNEHVIDIADWNIVLKIL